MTTATKPVVGDRVRLTSTDYYGEIKEIDHNRHGMGPWARVKWDKGTPNHITEWKQITTLENSAEPQASKEEAKEIEPNIDTRLLAKSSDALEQEAQTMLIHLFDLYAAIIEARKYETRYVRIRQALLNLIKDGSITEVKSTDVPLALAPGHSEIYTTGIARFSSQFGSIDELDTLAATLQFHLKELGVSNTGHPHPSLTLDSLRNVLLHMLRESKGEREEVKATQIPPQPKQKTRGLWRDPSLLQKILLHISTREVTQVDADLFGYKTAETLVNALRRRKVITMWSEWGWKASRDMSISREGGKISPIIFSPPLYEKTGDAIRRD